MKILIYIEYATIMQLSLIVLRAVEVTVFSVWHHLPQPLLLFHRADVNATDNFMWTPLHHACYNGHLEIAELIVKAGGAVDAPAIGSATPLMRAIEICRLDMVHFLMNAGADIQTTNSNGKYQCLPTGTA